MKPYLETVFTSVLAYVLVMVCTRLLNKEQVAQLTFYDYVAGITLGSIAAELAINANGRHWAMSEALIIIALLTFLTGYVAEKSRPLRKLIEGEPTIVVHNGKIMERNMGKLRYNMDNLTSQLRDKGVFNIGDLEFAILEPNGSLSVLLKSQKRPLQPADMGVPTGYEGLETELIVDGVVICENLQQNGLDEAWLTQQLRNRGFSSAAEVMYASLASDGSLFVDIRNDELPHITDITE